MPNYTRSQINSTLLLWLIVLCVVQTKLINEIILQVEIKFELKSIRDYQVPIVLPCEGDGDTHLGVFKLLIFNESNKYRKYWLQVALRLTWVIIELRMVKKNRISINKQLIEFWLYLNF